jgi:hypothetical protein
MRLILARLRPWAIGTAVLVTIFGLGYLLATRRPMDGDWVYPAILLGFLLCDRSFWSSRTR